MKLNGGSSCKVSKIVLREKLTSIFFMVDCTLEMYQLFCLSTCQIHDKHVVRDLRHVHARNITNSHTKFELKWIRTQQENITFSFTSPNIPVTLTGQGHQTGMKVKSSIELIIMQSLKRSWINSLAHISCESTTFHESELETRINIVKQTPISCSCWQQKTEITWKCKEQQPKWQNLKMKTL